jgi:hypothetical protein
MRVHHGMVPVVLESYYVRTRGVAYHVVPLVHVYHVAYHWYMCTYQFGMAILRYQWYVLEYVHMYAIPTTGLVQSVVRPVVPFDYTYTGWYYHVMAPWYCHTPRGTRVPYMVPWYVRGTRVRTRVRTASYHGT